MNAFTSRNPDAADMLALARLDDDGAPPAVTRPQAETTAIVPGEVADQTPALLGAGWRRRMATRRRAAAESAPAAGAAQRTSTRRHVLLSEIPDREATLSRDLGRVDCALVKIVGTDDRYYALVGEPELYRDGFRLETTEVLTLSQAEDWCRQEIARGTAADH
jgi:hypothetical protein